MHKQVMEVRAQQWMACIHATENSSLKIAEWCEQNNIAKSSYYKWKQKLQQQYAPLVGI